MLKDDRGTILYLRLFTSESAIPSVVNVMSEQVGGITFDVDRLQHAFKEGALSGLQKVRAEGSISLIKNSGDVIEASPALGRGEDITRIEFTVVYPDGSTKMGVRSAKDGIGTLIWNDDLVRGLNRLAPDYFGLATLKPIQQYW